LADRERFCGGLHPPPPDAHFGGTPPSRLPGPPISAKSAGS
jgi:hypothetical protein